MDPRARWERWRHKPVRLRFWRELALVVVFDLVYEWTSDFAGQNRSLAYRNALDQIRIEKALGLFQEHTIQAWALNSRLLIELSDLFYATAHFILPVVALLWVFHVDPARYLRWRDTLAWTTGIALVCFAIYPLMPPRMLPSGYGIVDTMVKIGGLGSWDTVLLKDAGNQFAAMPSLHISWALWAVLALYPTVKRRWLRVLLVVDPLATVAVILVTGNHYVVDIFGGLVVLAIGYGLAALRPRYLPWRVETRRRESAGLSSVIGNGPAEEWTRRPSPEGQAVLQEGG
jgi:hypothetical protein